MNLFFRNCVAILIGLFLVIPIVPANAASDSDTVTSVIKDFCSSISKNDMKAMTAAFAKRSSITDEFPPYYWQGSDAFSRWGKDFATDSTVHKVSDPVMTFGDIKHVRVSGNKAYVVAPASYAYKADGKPEVEQGLFTFALERTAKGWKISAMTWTIN